MKAEEFPYEYVGGGYFRLRSVPKGKPAPTLHGDEAVALALEWKDKQEALERETLALCALQKRYGC